MLSTPRTGVRAVLAAAVTVAVTVTLGPAATADHRDPVPTQEQVDRAAGAVADKTRDAAAIQTSLLLANQRLEHASMLAEVAAEKYNAAMWHLSEARAEVKKADARAAAAKKAVADQRDDIAALVTQRYRGGAQLDQLNALFSADGPSGVMDGYGAVHSVGDTMQAAFDRYRAANALAKVTLAKAADARAKAEQMAAGARAARDRATSAANEAQAAASSIAAEKSRLLDELATAQGISVRLATERQSALEEQARERAAAAARTRAEQEAREPAEQQARDKANPARAQAQSSPNPTPPTCPPARPQPDAVPQPVPQPASQPSPQPAPQPGPVPPARPERRCEPGDRVREGPARRALQLGCRGSELLGLLRPHHGGLGLGRPLAAALVGRPVPGRPATSPRASCARGTWCSGERPAAPARSTTWPCTSAAG